MLTDFQNKTRLHVIETLEGKFENNLILECIKCGEWNKNLFQNPKCLYCFLENLYINKKVKYKKIIIQSSDIILDFEYLDPLFEYFDKIEVIKNSWNELINIVKKSYKKDILYSKKFDLVLSLLELEEYKFLNPLLVYKYILKLRDLTKENFFIIKNHNLESIFNKLIGELFIIINDSEIIKKCYKHTDFLTENVNKPKTLIKFLFPKIVFQERDIEEVNGPENNKSSELIEEYYLGQFETFQVKIYRIPDEVEGYYEIFPFFINNVLEQHYLRIISSIIEETQPLEISKVLSIEDLINKYFKEIKNIIKIKYNLSDALINKIATLSTIKKINLEKLFPLLIDNYIEEIFLDAPDECIYLNHLKCGRCRTSIKLTEIEIERLKTLLRLYSGSRLDYDNPSIKYVIKNEYFYSRFAIDVEPINVHKFSIDIRKLNKNIFTIQDLLKNNTLSPLISAFLFFIIIRRINITVTGETDTGKTTLINALDLLVPNEFRKIYVENVIESLDQNQFKKHQLKYKVDSIEDFQEMKYTKSNQIKKLLHRTPDIIYLGEILTKEEAEAMFHCLSAGLRGFQTIHSNDINSLINRFIYHFNINSSCLKDLDLILLMKKINNDRKIISISEISEDLDGTNGFYQDLFIYKPNTETWQNIQSLYDSNCIKKVRLYEDLPEKKFTEIIDLYLDVFDSLKLYNRINNKDLISLFHGLSYYSRFKYNELEDYWRRMKNLLIK